MHAARFGPPTNKISGYVNADEVHKIAKVHEKAEVNERTEVHAIKKKDMEKKKKYMDMKIRNLMKYSTNSVKYHLTRYYGTLDVEQEYERCVSLIGGCREWNTPAQIQLFSASCVSGSNSDMLVIQHRRLERNPSKY